MNISFYRLLNGKPKSFGKIDSDKFTCDLVLNDIGKDPDELVDLIDGLEHGDLNYRYNGESFRLVCDNEDVVVEDVEEIETPSGIVRYCYNRKYLIKLLKNWLMFCENKPSGMNFISPSNITFYKDHFGCPSVAASDDMTLVAGFLESDVSRCDNLLSEMLDDIKGSNSKLVIRGVGKFKINCLVEDKIKLMFDDIVQEIEVDEFVGLIDSWLDFLR